MINIIFAAAAARGLSGQLGGLASLGGGGSNQTAMAKAVLQSRVLLADFIHRHNLSIPLVATVAWDMENEKWVINREVYNPEAGMVTLNIKSQSPPGAKEWAEKLVHDISEHMPAQDEYIFKTVDPAVVPQECSEPRRKIIIFIGTMYSFYFVE